MIKPNMATAKMSSRKHERIQWAKLEKAATDFIDSYIQKKLAIRSKTTVSELLNHFMTNAPTDIQAYIGLSEQDIQYFITSRNYLWKLSEEFIAMQSKEMRLTVLHLLLFVQNRNKERRRCQLRDVWTFVRCYLPLLKRRLDRDLTRLQAMKAFLLAYPSIFCTDRSMYQDTGEGSILIKNRALAVDGGVILPQDVDSVGQQVQEQKQNVDTSQEGPVIIHLPSCTLADLEMVAVEFIDSQIDAHHGLVNIAVLMQVDIAPETDAYIKYTSKDIRNFIIIRNHLWSVSAGPTITVQKVPQEFRVFISGILKFVQERCSRVNRHGVNLQDICGLVGDQRDSMRHILGDGNKGIKQFLLKYPSLFLMYPFNPWGTWSFINLAIYSDKGVIIMCDENGKKLNSSVYYSGRGTTKMLVQSFGFIKDKATQKDLYFALDSFKDFEHSGAFDPRLEYIFEAVISPQWNGRNPNKKWKIFNLIPVPTE